MKLLTGSNSFLVISMALVGTLSTIRAQTYFEPIMMNSTVEKMVANGDDLATIVQAIKRAAQVDFLIDNYEAFQLIRAGASNRDVDQILMAMRDRMRHGPVPVPSPAPAAAVSACPQLVTEVNNPGYALVNPARIVAPVPVTVSTPAVASPTPVVSTPVLASTPVVAPVPVLAPAPVVAPLPVLAPTPIPLSVLPSNLTPTVQPDTPVTQGDVYERMNRVFVRMMGTPDFQGGPMLPYSLTYLNTSSVVNAYSKPNGSLYVTAGLVQAIHGNDGVLAAIIGHEMVHSRNRHAAKTYERKQVIDYEYRRLYAKNGALAASVYLAAAMVLEKKLEREQEHEADQLGLRIAAEAGYHPDYAIVGERMLLDTGEQTKFAAFFSDHPRWATREERTERNYDEALTYFDRYWPNVDQSPGGRPPTIAIVSPVKFDKKQQVGSITVRIRNLRGSTAEVQIYLAGERDPNPIQITTKTYNADQTEKDTVLARLSTGSSKGRKGKQYLNVRVVAGNDELFRSTTRVK